MVRLICVVLIFVPVINGWSGSTAEGYDETSADTAFNITEDVIAYDGNPSIYFQDLTEPGTVFDVRFTPLEPCSLVAAEVVTYLGSGNGIIHVYSDSGGLPGQDLIAPFSVNLWGNLLRQRINLAAPLEIGDSDFHLALEYSQAPPPYAALDNNGGVGRSSHRVPGEDWTVIPTHDLNIRAYVNYYASDHDPPEIECLPRVLGFSVEETYRIDAEMTDISGVLSASIFYSPDSLNYNEIVMINTSGDTWSAEIPAQPAGSTVYYYLSAEDNSLNHNVGTFPEGGAENPFTLTIVEGYEMSYDDGGPESFWIVGSAWDNNRFAVRITPNDYPLRISGARVMVDGGTPFNITINEDNSGIPGILMSGPFELSRNVEDWAILFIPEEQQPMIYAGDFWVVFHWQMNSPASPAVGIDTTAPDSRSKRYTDTTGWIPVNGADFIMRAFGVGYTSGMENESGSPNLADEFVLRGNFPNPFNSSTEMRILALHDSYASLKIFDLAGRVVKTVFEGSLIKGENRFIWNGRNSSDDPVSSGIYFYRLSSGNYSQTRKMILLK